MGAKPRVLLVVVICGLLAGLSCAPAAPSPTLAPPTSTPVAAKPTPSPTPAVVPTKSAPAPTALAPKPTPAGTPAAEKPVRGGTFIQVEEVGPDFADFARSSVVGTLPVSTNVHLGVLMVDTQDRISIVGDMAESWSVSPDGKVYTFKIRPGLKTHKGRPFNAYDAEYSLRRNEERPNEVPLPRWGSLRAALKEAKATDEQTLVVTLEDPIASFLPALAQPYIAIQPKYVLEKVDAPGKGRDLLPEELDGAGPFKVEKYIRANFFVLNRHDGYYKSGLPYLDTFQMVVMPDRATRLAAFRVARVHLLDTFRLPMRREVDEIKAELGDKVVFKQLFAPGWRGFHLNINRPPFDKKEIRVAMNLAVNRDEVLQLALEGDGLLAGPYLPT